MSKDSAYTALELTEDETFSEDELTKPRPDGYHRMSVRTAQTAQQEYQDNLLKAEDLRKLLEEVRVQERSLLEDIAQVKPKFDAKREQLVNDITLKEANIQTVENRIHRIQAGPEAEPPPGPKSLLWVEGHYFLAIATLVIILNIVTIVLETLDEHYEKDFFWLDQFFMVFYILEVVLKLQLWRSRFFCDPHRMWWNLLDFSIVVSGIIDMYIQPLLVVTGILRGTSDTFTSIARFLRFLRLLRILKIVRVFLDSDMEWTQKSHFQIFIMAVIGVNSIVMGFETDVPNFSGWIYVEHLFLLIFTFELLVRLKHQGLSYFTDPTTAAWNYIDFIIVAGGIMDQWAMPTVSFIKVAMGDHSSATGGNIGQIMITLRMLRLLRLLRLVRLVRSIPPLFDLVVGIVQAVQGMFWVLVLTVTFLYACSLLCVRLFGHGLVFGGEAPEEVAAIFPSVFQAFFILFKLMNGDGDALEPLLTAMPLTKAFFLFYMVVSTWAILSILTAVVSENMIATTEASREESEAQHEEDRRKFTETKLRILFFEMDKDSDMTLTRSEFRDFIKDPVSCEQLKVVSRNKLDEEDLWFLFNTRRILSESGNADEDYIKIQDFTDALGKNEEDVRQSSIFRLNNRLTCLEVAVRNNMKDMMDAMTGGEGGSGFNQQRIKDFLSQKGSLEQICGFGTESANHEMKKRMQSFKQKSGAQGVNI